MARRHGATRHRRSLPRSATHRTGFSSTVLLTLLPAIVLALFPSPARCQQDTTWHAPPSADTLHSTLSDQTAAAKAGKKIFSAMCVVCHGAQGNGKGVASVTLEPRPADFLSIRVEDESDGAIFWKMTHGKAPMAAYRTLLTPEQRWELVAYIRTLEARSG
ncbi:MAG: cytochrome c [Gemmatimonadota bacterium]